MSLIERISTRILGPRKKAEKLLQLEIEGGEPEIRLVPVLAEKDRDFLDIGANFGSYSLYALPYYRQVIAGEPHPAFKNWLPRLLKPNGRWLNCAFSDHAGTATLHVPIKGGGDITTRSSLEDDANPGFELRAVEVELKTIDSFGFDKIAVLKMDVEGHELTALKGAVETLRRCKPVCIIESEERHNVGGVAKIFAFFESLGFGVYYIHDGRLCEGKDFDVDVLQRQENAKSVDAGRNPDYVNNFIFVHPDNAAALEKIRRSLG
jgi:FkbM family methyltransferase